LDAAEEIVRFKGTLVLLLVFAALGGYVYFTDFYGKEARDKQEEAKKRLFGGEAKDITELSLENEGRTITAVRKGEKEWEITSPAGLEADSDTWEQLATSFVEVQKDEVVKTEKADLTAYGLDKPGIVAQATFKDGKSQSVLIGSENPKKTFNYAKRGDSEEVFLLPTSGTSSFKKTPTDLRNKKVLDFESDNIDVVRISSAGQPEIEIQKSGADWSIKKPLEARADNAEVLSLLSAIQFSRTSAFADEKIDAKAAGLDAPVAKVVVHDQKAGQDKTLLFGKSPEKDKYYARDASRPPIFILATEIIDKAKKPVFDWRDKTLVRFGDAGSSGVDQIDVVRGGEKLSLKKTGSDWAADGAKLQLPKVMEMLAMIDSERAIAFGDAPGSLGRYGLEKPRLEIVLHEKGKEVGRLQFGSESSNPAGVYLKTANPSVQTVKKELYDKLNVRQADLAEPPPAPAPAPAAPAK
jgi:hypothetical protein